MKFDIYRSEERYREWRKNCQTSLTKENEKILLNYLDDMELGINVGKYSKKGSRSYVRLQSLRNKISFVMKKIEEEYSIPLTEIGESQIFRFFRDMEQGIIVKQNGRPYRAVGDYIKIFKAFWHWWMKSNKKGGVSIGDITEDLWANEKKPKWVYLDGPQIKKILFHCDYKTKILIFFLLDSGLRAPTELMNVRVSDFNEDFSCFNLRDEVSKTYGRKIRLRFCTSLIRDYIEFNGLKGDDFLFKICPAVVNRHLKELGLRLFGDSNTRTGAKYSELTLYDFRHISCCLWTRICKDPYAVMKRFGWKDMEKIYYYSEFVEESGIEEDLVSF